MGEEGFPGTYLNLQKIKIHTFEYNWPLILFVKFSIISALLLLKMLHLDSEL